jgi:hypothetical protein
MNLFGLTGAFPVTACSAFLTCSSIPCKVSRARCKDRICATTGTPHKRHAGSESVNLYEAPLRGFYRVVASVFWGGLIQVLAGISGGSGGLLTKRSGWAA